VPDYELLCLECGRRFKAVASRFGDELCPSCGSIDLRRLCPPAEKPAAAASDGPPRGESSTAEPQ
jgi:rRNA maturation endonuclease Nob1